VGPNGTGTSKIDLHWRQVSCQVMMTSRLPCCGIAFEPDTNFPFCFHKQWIWGKLNIKSKVSCVNSLTVEIFHRNFRRISTPARPTSLEGVRATHPIFNSISSRRWILSRISAARSNSRWLAASFISFVSFRIISGISLTGT
jgi:hypothetical protein